jgi:hypothetical protein
MGRRLPLAIRTVVRLLDGVAHFKAAIPVSARPGREANVRIAACNRRQKAT